MDGDLTYWSEAVSSLPDREMRSACNAAIDTLPTNANLALWYRGQMSAQCKLCGHSDPQACAERLSGSLGPA